MVLGFTEVVIGILAIILGFYYYFTRIFNFWTLRGVPGPKPVPIFGTVKDAVFGRYSQGLYVKSIYDEYANEPFVGIFSLHDPVLVLRDTDLIKLVLIRDSKCFMNRANVVHEKYDPLSANLFNLDLERWQPLRKKLTPVFTSGKIKEMFYLLSECADQLDHYLDQVEGKSVDVREICAKFTIDVIGVCVFGLQANALADNNSTFHQMGRRIFGTNFKNMLNERVKIYSPPLYNLIGDWLVDHELHEFFINLTKDTINYRKENNIFRHDFIDLLRTLKDEPTKLGDLELTDTLLAAQLYIFFIAGFETSSSTMSNCLFELAMNHHVQERLHEEIRTQLAKVNGVISYEAINNMKYLDKVINETLRKYPLLTVMTRKTTVPYSFPGIKIPLPKGTKIWIPLFGIQRDPKYFPQPEVFDPERFGDETTKTYPEIAFLPFGIGPRNCIGARFGSIQTKVGLVKILQNHTVDVCEETDKNYTIDPRTFLLAPKYGTILRINPKHKL